MIKKLDEFAQNGDKSISGLTLTTGFPRQQKPFRQWMNYLFNWLAVKQNEVIDSINALDSKVEPLLKPIAIGEGFFTVNDYRSASEVAAAKGYGTWQRFAEGKTLVGYSSKTTDLDDYRIMGNEFGANTHKLTIAETPSHSHSTAPYNKFAAKASDTALNSTVVGGDRNNTTEELAIGRFTDANWTLATEKSIGGNQPHNNIQPSIVVAYWLRVA